MEKGEELGGKLISPAKEESKEKLGIGLYPDRAFFKNEVDLNKLTSETIEAFSKSIDINVDTINNYFNIMGICIEATEESEAISTLNRQLDVLELANRCESSVDRGKVLKLIYKRKESPLFKHAFGNENFDIPWLALIAANELKHRSEITWDEIVSRVKVAEDEKIKKEAQLYIKNNKISEDEYWDFIDEADFYKQISNTKNLNDFFKSYHKYFCIVQADGDKMGAVISQLENGKLYQLSESLISFGENVSKIIEDYGGLPIYAGGDDLLFIAPVVSEFKTEQKNESKSQKNIWDLIELIDKLYGDVVKKASDLQKGEDKQTTSMSYSISISYYKHPLYEALATARHLLFDKAKIKRNSIACRLQKHSGATLEIVLNKKNEEFKKAFMELIAVAVPNNMVSAVAHKLRENKTLWALTNRNESRIDAFFKKIMGLGEKGDQQDEYLKAVKKLMIKVFETIEEEEWENYLYPMLRIAKFINGEEVKDE